MERERSGTGAGRAVQLIASGRVQGVGFRYFVVRVADSCGVVGYVRNLADGDVEVWAEGPEAALERLAEAVGRGPRLAQVSRLTRTDAKATGSFHRFEVRF